MSDGRVSGDGPKARWMELPLLVSVFLVAPAAYAVVVATRAAAYSALGRDQGIFQYFAWAIRQGEALYRDIRDVNGPLTTAVHLVFQRLGGEDEFRFRVLDLVVTGVVFAMLGACLPGIASPASAGSGKRLLPERLFFAAATWVVLCAQYLSHLYWDLAQRETFADWFLLSSVIFQLLASAGAPRLRASAALVVSGIFITTAFFGKPTFLLFGFGQLFALVMDDEIVLRRLHRSLFWFFGICLGSVFWLVWIHVFGDLGSYLKIAIFEAPVLYRYIWARAIRELFLPEFALFDTVLGLSGLVCVVFLVASGQMKRRALSLAFLPIGAILSLIAQRKGFMYHYHPLGVSSRLVALLVVLWAAERATFMPDRRVLRSGFALLLGLSLGLVAARQAYTSPHWIMAPRLFAVATTKEGRASEAYFQLYTEWHYYPWQMREAAAYIQEHTRPDERIQVYGMDPYFYFLAQRQSSTPYVYAYDLNVSAALAGGTGAKPDAEATTRILAMQAEHEADMLARFEKNAPAAFVFIEHAPMTTYWDDAVRDFEESCPKAAVFLDEHYEEAIRFGVVRVFLPK